MSVSTGQSLSNVVVVEFTLVHHEESVTDMKAVGVVLQHPRFWRCDHTSNAMTFFRNTQGTSLSFQYE